MSSCCRRNKAPLAHYGTDYIAGEWSEELIANQLAAGFISESRAAELRSTLGTTTPQRLQGREDLVCKAMKGDGAAIATLNSYGLRWENMVDEQKACKQKTMMKYGAAAAGIGALAYYFTAGKKK